MSRVAKDDLALLDSLWPPTWFPFMWLYGCGYLAADLGDGTSPTSAVHAVFFDGSEHVHVSPTMLRFFEDVLDKYHTGLYSIDPSGVPRGPSDIGIVT